MFEINLEDDTVVDPLSKEITVTDKHLPVDSKSVKSVESRMTRDQQFDPNDQMIQQAGAAGGSGVLGDFDQDPSLFIPVYEGEVSKFVYILSITWFLVSSMLLQKILVHPGLIFP